MTDIVKRLREAHSHSWLGPKRQVISEDDIMWGEIEQAANEIERLRAVLIHIKTQSAVNGEDVSYVIANTALKVIDHD